MPGKIGKYQVGRTLGSGASCKVKLGLHEESKRKVAIKIMNKNLDPETQTLVMTEVEALQKLNGHENILQIFEQGRGEYQSKGKTKEVSYIVLEIAQGGELFDFIACSGKFSEDLARFYFKQFMSGLKFVHDSGYTHRDLKPENLMLDQNFVLKIADFGFAGPVEGRDGGGTLSTNLGTLNYMAPEIHLGQEYEGRSIDIFAAAIILFIMVSEHPPFTAAQPSDPFYRCLAAGRADMFWKCHQKEKDEGFYSEEFKDLIQSMLHLDPQSRLTMDDVINHPWMDGNTPDKSEVNNEFRSRKKNVDSSIAQEKNESRQTRISGQVMRSGDNTATVNAMEEVKESEQLYKELLKYEQVFSQNTEFFTHSNPNSIEQTLLKHLKEKEHIDPKVNKDHYKVKFKMTTKGQDASEQETEICVRILEVDETKRCVEFTKLKGTQVNFHEHFNEIKQVLAQYNNAINEAVIESE